MAARPGRAGAGHRRAAVRLRRLRPADRRRRALALRIARGLAPLLLGPLLLGAGLVGAPPVDSLPVGPLPVGAGPVGAPLSAVAQPATGCTVVDQRLDELSGLVSAGPRWWAVADGGRVARAVVLDPAGCATAGARSAPVDPADVEDLGIGPDGALWLADTGDNVGRRDEVAMIVLPRSAPARVHRLAYPDGPHDAEAVVVADDGVPLVITKTTGAAGVYRPSGPLSDGGAPVPLERVGEIVLPESGTTGGPLGSLGSRTVTGAGLSPAGASGRVVAVRTYTDAWLFRLPNGTAADADALVTALGGAPVQVPLPDEPQGEAVALTADGSLLSGTEARGGRPAAVRTLPGAVAAALAPDAPATAQPDVPPPTSSSTSVVLPAAVGAAVVALVLVGLAGAMTVHARRRR